MKSLALWASALALALSAGAGCAQADAPLAAEAVAIEFLDVGQGDATLIRSPEGKTALVDAGPSNHVVSLLERHGIDTLDMVVVTHHHADHYGGMAAVVKRFHPRVFLATDSPHTSAHYLRLLELVRDQGIRAITPTSTTREVALGSVGLTIFPQAPDDPHEENNNSVGIRVRYGNFSVLLPGDAERAERAWWERTVPSLCAGATVLKLAHHGSRNGTDARWLELVRPRLAVASLGKDNEFGHPHPETLAVLARFEVPLLRTDRDGTVTVRSDGRRWHVDAHAHFASEVPSAPEDATDDSHVDHHVKNRPPDRPLDLNEATEDELRTIPGIGPTLARRIIAGRPYRSVNDLRNVTGIGQKRFTEIRPFVRVD